VLLRVEAGDADDRVARIADAVIPRAEGGVVRVAAVADIVMEASPGAIRRSDGRRSVTIELTLEGSGAETRAVEAAIKEVIALHALPVGVTVELPAPAAW
jgi:multidrug efflux pump subunit AcrB